MLKPIVVLMAIILTQSGCSVFGEYTDEIYRPFLPLEKERQELERLKREFLQIEDLKIGTGPIAAFGRKITADVVIRYTGDGTLAYEGPVLTYLGIDGAPFIHNSLRKAGLLSLDQPGIFLGLNGMAVGGKRRFTISPKLVCGWDGPDEPRPGSTCGLVTPSKKGFGGMARKESLMVEATLTVPVPPSPVWDAEARTSVGTSTSPNESPATPSGACTMPSHFNRESRRYGVRHDHGLIVA